MKTTASVLYEMGLERPYADSQPLVVEEVDLEDRAKARCWSRCVPPASATATSR